MVQKRLKSLKRSLRKPVKVNRSIKKSKRQVLRKNSKRKNSKRKSSKRKSLKRKSLKRKSLKRSKRNSARFAVIPDELLKYNNVEELDRNVDLYIDYKLLENGLDDKKLRSSYIKLSLDLHPDKNPQNLEGLATKLFQRLDRNYSYFKNINPEQRADILQNILKEKEKQMHLQEKKQQSFSQKSILRKQREMERISKMSTEEKRKEVSRLLKQLKNIRERKEQENYYILSFFSSHTEKMNSFERMERDLLDDIDMLNGFEFEDLE